MSAADVMTILRAHHGNLTKTIGHRADGWQIHDYTAGAFYAAYPQSVTCFAELVDTLESVSRYPQCAVLRGEIAPGVDARRCRRLSDRAKHGDNVTFVAAARRWLAADVDSLPEPPGCIFAAEPEDGIEHAIAQLPEPFHDASCWWQATSSAGVKPGIRCRLWFWLSRPVDDAEAKGWLKCHPVDRSIFTPVGLHYVAAPILEPGTPDPVIRRQGVRTGLEDAVEVPMRLPRIEPITAEPVRLDGQELTEADVAALTAAVRRCPRVRAIWTGERTYSDRSSAHFALAASLARFGCRDADTLHRVLVAYDRRRGVDIAKILRPDYAARTIAAALASERGR